MHLPCHKETLEWRKPINLFVFLVLLRRFKSTERQTQSTQVGNIFSTGEFALYRLSLDFKIIGLLNHDFDAFFVFGSVLLGPPILQNSFVVGFSPLVVCVQENENK